MEKKIGVPWIEKYRPIHFNKIELDPIIKHKLKKIIGQLLSLKK